MEGIKNLIIDFGGVIINLTRNRCIEAFESLGVQDIREQIVNNYQHKDLFMQVEIGSITSVGFRDGIRRLSGQALTDEQIDAAWIAMLDDVPDYKLNLLLDLRKHYNTMLLSNTNEIHWEWSERTCFSYKGHHVSDFFNRIYLSYKLHMLKPNADIFEYVLQDAGIKPEETLFIDDATPNCRTAESLGLHTYTPEPREDWSFLFK
ncbi:HAD family phosphatase [Parabacteroides acidifaciens]|uniref:HAD family phosphatase n=1 Tax=Parabacteroides acidifaciens TaxID=2290935 RepID=A0A3D8HJJ7_9BACT|nr:HAD family phosphatase [Parabacteroides acidifaciens]MBC8600208.1 HAD family phosphatase [Parabacteroides acidifaciens]RDU51155.1 HAD family phosphatase [Parabacteroides acidifaciens]